MTKVVFSFDTEDYVHSCGADGILRSAKLLKKAGVKGCFQIVAYLAKALKDWGRDDVIEELKNNHEIEFHSLMHSQHPTINEYTDRCDFYGASKDFRLFEDHGVEIINEIFGVNKFYCAVPPGSSNSYVAHYNYAEMGIPTYAASMIKDKVHSRPVSCCNILSLPYNKCLDTYLPKVDEQKLKEMLDTAAEHDVFVFYHHPQMCMLKDWWDELNYNGVNTPKEKWVESERLPLEVTEKFYENFEVLVNLLKEDPRFEITTFAGIAEAYKSERTVKVTDIAEISKQLSEEWFPVTTPDSYCLSDIFHACREFLNGKTEHICGKVYGFLATPYAITEPVTLKAEDIKKSAKFIADDGFIPEHIYVGDKILGPADWIRAAIEVISGKDEVEILPGEWQIDLDQFPSLKNMDFSNIWIHAKSLKDNYLSDRFRLQTWTIRLPKETKRKVF